jgi:hypothetical protein
VPQSIRHREYAEISSINIFLTLALGYAILSSVEDLIFIHHIKFFSLILLLFLTSLICKIWKTKEIDQAIVFFMIIIIITLVASFILLILNIDLSNSGNGSRDYLLKKLIHLDFRQKGIFSSPSFMGLTSALTLCFLFYFYKFFSPFLWYFLLIALLALCISAESRGVNLAFFLSTTLLILSETYHEKLFGIRNFISYFNTNIPGILIANLVFFISLISIDFSDLVNSVIVRNDIWFASNLIILDDFNLTSVNGSSPLILNAKSLIAHHGHSHNLIYDTFIKNQFLLTKLVGFLFLVFIFCLVFKAYFKRQYFSFLILSILLIFSMLDKALLLDRFTILNLFFYIALYFINQERFKNFLLRLNNGK